MDKDIVRWILEFLLRQSLDDRTLNALIRVLPISDNDSNLKKLLLLKKIESEISKGSISENLLELLEQIEQLDYGDGNESEAMKKAYCAVAVRCTVKLMEENGIGKCFEAVKSIWGLRVSQMGKCSETVELVSDELMSWRNQIEGLVCGCRSLLLKSEEIDVFKIVRAYVEDAKENIGPCFLEMVADTLGEDKLKLLGMGNEDVVRGPRRKHVAVKPFKKLKSKTTRGAKIVDTDDMGVGTSDDKYDCLSPCNVTKLEGFLRSSSTEPQPLVKDPPPDTPQMANNVTSNLETVDERADVFQADESNIGNKRHSQQTNKPKPSLMAQNNTARTYEWEESIDGSADRSSGSHIPSPRVRVVSVKKENSKPSRRKRKFWSELEVDTLRAGVQKYGVGNWKFILNMYKDIFNERTEVDLKDKWRNLIS